MINQIQAPIELLNNLATLLADSGNKGALILIRLHGMSRMASIFGTRITEEIILGLIEKIEQGIRPTNTLMRLGRYEFAIFIANVLNRGHATLAANKVAGLLSQPIVIQGKERNLPFSIGLSVSPLHTTDPEQLCKYADLALIAAKITQSPYQVFDPEDLAGTVTDWDIEGDLEKAIANNQFTLNYQPKISAATGQIIGAEALLRWNHPTHGRIPPDQFIPIAERNGLMPKVTWWVLNSALRERKQWGNAAQSLSIAINISALDLTDKSFFKSVTSAIGLWNTPPELLTLEITEGSLMKDIAFSANILRKIQAHGIKVSIDDFGTGYSSLAYFKQLPANELKIDRSFILNILNDELDQHIVSTIIQMAKKMRLDIVAEGVETARMLDTLTELGCDIMQGYHIARPMPQQEFVAWIASNEQDDNRPGE
ncbi:MAG: GGDEF domain-containing phosphodiesterase [Sedimenticola sp.]|nr:GGDEF domain-containing phosphodiesterase [Sedimenticola sp.]